MIFKKIADVENLNKIVSQLGDFGNDVDKIVDSVKNLSDEQLQLVFSASGLSDELVEQVTVMRAHQAVTTATTGTQASQITVVQGLSAKYKALAASIGLSTTALTALIAGVAALGIGIAVFNHFYDTAKETTEKVKELVNEFNSLKKKADEQAKTIESLVSRYEQLSKGVNSLGENISLTNEEYEEYNSLVNDIADMFPELIQGYTNEGNAILSLKGNVEQLRDAYKEAQKEAYNLLIVRGENSDGNDIITQWKRLSESDWLNSQISGNDFNQKAKRDVAALIANSNGDVDYLLNQLTKTLKDNDYDSNDMLNFIQDEIGLKIGGYNRFDGFGKMYQGVEITPEDIKNIRNSALAVSQTYQAEINSALGDVRSLANAYLMTNDVYNELDNEEVKNAASIIVNSLDANIASQFEDKFDVGEYVGKVLANIKDDESVQNALVNLFTMDTNNMPISEMLADIDRYVNIIAIALEENPIELKARLGFDESLSDTYARVIDYTKNKFGIYFQDKSIETFFDTYSVNTEDEIDKFLEIAKVSDSATEAMRRYKEECYKAPDLPIISEDSLDKAKTYRDELGKLYDALSLLRSGEATPAVINELIQKFPELSKHMDDIEGGIEDLVEKKLEALRDAFDGAINEEALRRLAEYSVKQEAVVGTIETTTDALNNLVSAYKNVAEAMEQYNQSGFISLELLESIMSMKPEYLGALMDEWNNLENTTDAYKAYMKVRLMDYKTSAWDEALVNNRYAYAEHKERTEGLSFGSKEYQESLKQYQEIAELNNDAAIAKQKFVNGILENFDEWFGTFTKSSSTDSVLDWVEIKINSIKEAIEELKDEASDPFKSWADRSSSLQKALNDTKALEKFYKKAAQVYLDKANSVGLGAGYTEKIRSGAWSIADVPEDITADEYEKIQEYQKWWDKYQEMVKAQEGVARELNDLTQDSFDNILAQFDAKLSHYENAANMIEAKLANAESKGYMATKQYYATLHGIESAKKAELEKQLSDLTEALGNTNFETDSEAWSNLTGEIEATEIAIQEATNAMQEFDNQIRQINWDLFDFAREQESKLMNEADFMIVLLDSAKLFSEAGEMTAEGIATMGLHAQNYNSYLEQSIDYAKELDYLMGKFNETNDVEWLNKYNERLELQQESILAAEAEKDAMIDLVSEGIELQKDAFQDLIDQYTEALDVQKD